MHIVLELVVDFHPLQDNHHEDIQYVVGGFDRIWDSIGTECSSKSRPRLSDPTSQLIQRLYMPHSFAHHS
jgi:hypothetical protein